jgi:hypothetical protein
VPAAEMIGCDVDLNDLGLLRVKLLPREVGAQQQQGLAFGHRQIARFPADNAGHADVVRVVMFKRIFGAGRVGDGRLEPLGYGQDFGMGTTVSRTAIDRDLVTARIEDVSDTVKVCVTRPDYGHISVDRIRDVIARIGMGDVNRNDQHGDAAFCNGGLSGNHGFAACLLEGNDHVAEHAA